MGKFPRTGFLLYPPPLLPQPLQGYVSRSLIPSTRNVTVEQTRKENKHESYACSREELTTREGGLYALFFQKKKKKWGKDGNPTRKREVTLKAKRQQAQTCWHLKR